MPPGYGPPGMDPGQMMMMQAMQAQQDEEDRQMQMLIMQQQAMAMQGGMGPSLGGISIGAGGISSSRSSLDDTRLVVSESPPGVEDDIYELAYQDEMKRIMDEKGSSTALFLNRRVEHLDNLKSQINVVADRGKDAAKIGMRQLSNMSSGGFADIVRQVSNQVSSVVERMDSSKDPNIDVYPGT